MGINRIEGLAAQLLNLLIGIAKQKGIRRTEGTVLQENSEMLNLVDRLGCDLERSPDGAVNLQCDQAALARTLHQSAPPLFSVRTAPAPSCAPTGAG